MSRHVAFFDLDNTILNTNSGKLFIIYSYKSGSISLFAFLLRIFVAFLWSKKLLNTEYVIKKWISEYQGISEDKMIDFSKRMFSDIILSHIRETAKKELLYHKNNSGKTVLLSAALPYVCNPVKEFLGMDDVICTQLEIQNGIASGRLSGKYCHGEEKLISAEEYCRSNGYRIDEAYYYADSIADVHVLEKVRNPVCVTPDRRLKKLAMQKGWKIEIWE